jgi:hypothetical protein
MRPDEDDLATISAQHIRKPLQQICPRERAFVPLRARAIGNERIINHGSARGNKDVTGELFTRVGYASGLRELRFGRRRGRESPISRIIEAVSAASSRLALRLSFARSSRLEHSPIAQSAVVTWVVASSVDRAPINESRGCKGEGRGKGALPRDAWKQPSRLPDRLPDR